LIGRPGSNPALLPYPDSPAFLLRMDGFQFINSFFQTMGIGIVAGLWSLTDEAELAISKEEPPRSAPGSVSSL
jgi:hypothetical protein